MTTRRTVAACGLALTLASVPKAVSGQSAQGSLRGDQTRDQTWTGQISDSLCKAKHEEAAEGQGKMTDHDCTVACVRGGSKYVLLVDGKLYQIANQAFGDLATHAGHTVKLTGELKGDEITVSRIEMP